MQPRVTTLRKRYYDELRNIYQHYVNAEGEDISHDAIAGALEEITALRSKTSLPIVLSGMSGAGKTTIGKLLEGEHEYMKLRNVYTRAMRPSETDKDGIFIDLNTFNAWQELNRFAVVNETNGTMHGVLTSDLESARSNVKVWADKSVSSMIKLTTLLDARLIYILPGSFDELYDRLVARERDTKEGMSIAEILDRLDEEIAELARSVELPYEYIVNTTPHQVVRWVTGGIDKT